MKKIIAIAICVLMMCAAAVPAFAGQDDSALSNVAVDVLFDFDGLDENSGFQMRGFTASPDGKYVYGGFLQASRHVTKVDTATGERVAQYTPEIENDDYDGVIANNNYPKGLAVDCRGYLFVGITHDVPNTSYISIACVDPDTIVDPDLLEMKEVSVITENLNTDRVGINGVAAQKIGDKILLYVVTCYNKDTLRCYDVTDVTDMKLYDGFGVGGVSDYNELTGSQSDPGYLTVDVDGYIYLCYKKDGSSYSKGSHVMKIEKDGKSVVTEVELPEAYGISTAGDYLFVSTYDGADSKVVVLNKSDLSHVSDIVYEDQINALSGCAYGGDRLYIGDHGDGSSGLPGTILMTQPLNITRDPRETETAERQHIDTPDTTTVETTVDPEQPTDSFVLFDFSDPTVVSKLTSGNSCEFAYDEENACLKITCTGSDPYFTLPMKKAQWFDGDQFTTLVLNYKTDIDGVTGEIFFTTKESADLVNNHLTYYMDATEEFADLEIDMLEDDQGTWGGQIRSIRLDPSTSDEEDQVFYLKSITMKHVEPEEVSTEPDTTEEITVDSGPSTEDTEPDTTKGDDTTKAAPTTTGGDGKKGSNKTGLIIGIVAGVVVLAGAACGIILSKKKKK